MISRRNFIKKAALSLAAVPFLASVKLEMPEKMRAIQMPEVHGSPVLIREKYEQEWCSISAIAGWHQYQIHGDTIYVFGGSFPTDDAHEYFLTYQGPGRKWEAALVMGALISVEPPKLWFKTIAGEKAVTSDNYLWKPAFSDQGELWNLYRRV